MSRNAEARIQAAVVEFVRTVAPEVLIFSIPNGGLRTKAEAALLRWTGVVSGIPDLMLIYQNPRWQYTRPAIACWEIKTADGKLSSAQADMLARLDDMGVPTWIIRSVDDARAALAVLGISTREAVAA